MRQSTVKGSVAIRKPESRTGAIRRATTALSLVLALGLAGTATADPCVVSDNGSGTVTLPPIGCAYLSPAEVHVIVDGLPPGTTLELAPEHKGFVCGQSPANPAICSGFAPGECERPGGLLAGSFDCAASELVMQITGTGALAGFNRTISLFSFNEVHTAPRTPGDPVQSFDTEIVALGASILPGDPDFAVLEIQAGQAFGLGSPGHTTLTDLGNGTFAVDSFFDITYTIQFQGAVGSALDGLSGTTQATIQMRTGEALSPIPSVSGGGLALFAALLLGSAALLLVGVRRVSAK